MKNAVFFSNSSSGNCWCHLKIKQYKMTKGIYSEQGGSFQAYSPLDQIKYRAYTVKHLKILFQLL